MVYAKVEKIRLPSAAGDEGLERSATLVHVPLESEEQLAEVQARAALRKRSGSVRATALGPH